MSNCGTNRELSPNQATTQGAPSRLMRKREAADFLRVSTRTLENWTAAGLPCYRPSPRLSLYDPDALLRWLKDSYAVAAKPSSYRPRVTSGGGK